MIRIHSIETFGKDYGPGTRLVLFLQGCNFHCACCHNPSIISPTGGKEYSVAEIMDLLEEQRSYFVDGGGLTVSGGEPLLQTKKLLILFEEVRKSGFNIVLDTNGSIWTPESRKLISSVDLVIFNLKLLDGKAHREMTGASNLAVLENIEEHDGRGKPYWIRYVLVSGLTDTPEALEKLGAFCANLKNLERLELLPCKSGSKPSTPEQLVQAKKILDKFCKKVFIK